MWAIVRYMYRRPWTWKVNVAKVLWTTVRKLQQIRTEEIVPDCIYSLLKPKLLFVLQPENLRSLLKRVHQWVTWCLIVHKHLNYVSSVQASETGSNITWLELSIRIFRTKNNTILFPENNIATIVLTSIIQVLLEHNSSHKAYATITIFIYDHLCTIRIPVEKEFICT